MKYFINLLIIIIFFVNIVFPNSFQTLSITLLFVINFLILMNFKLKFSKIYLFWVVLSMVFSCFILASDISSAHKIELIFKYCFSPILWINILMYLFSKIKSEIIFKWGVIFFIFSIFSVLILYVLTSLGFTNFTSFFIETVNINQNTGLGFTLHVYGSLVFFTVALIPILKMINNVLLKYVLVITLIIAVILSGRTALYLSVILSFLYFIINYREVKINSKVILSIILLSVLVLILYVYVYNQFFEIDLFDYIFDIHINKVISGGGSERSTQFDQIVEAIQNNPFGNGFISLQQTRDILRPFNYENLILSTIMRFGIVIFLFIIFTLKDIFLFLNKKNKDNYSNIFFLGFLGIIIASFTNPYLESFSFQWMFFAPIVFLTLKNEGNISN